MKEVQEGLAQLKERVEEDAAEMATRGGGFWEARKARFEQARQALPELRNYAAARKWKDLAETLAEVDGMLR